jgi:membrane associated rhomboid family serine protease
MIPLHDDNPTTLTPIVTVGFIVICVAVFLWQITLPPGGFERAVYAYGMIPAVLFGERELPAEVAVLW